MNTTTDTRPLVERITQELEPRESTNDTPAHLDRGIKYSPAWVECAWDGNAEAEANVELIYDAFNTSHRTRRTPSELASERQELLDMLATLLNRAETVAEGIPVNKRHAGVSPATHVAHMASHLAQHCKPARELINRLTETTNPTEQ